MSRRGTRAGLAVALAALAVAGLAGVYSYASDYNLHRGFAALVQFRRAGTGRLLQVDFYSRALGRRADYLAYLPPHYSSRHRYPVYYLLHGSPGKPRVWVDIANMDVRLDNQLSLGRARPLILIYPDGRIGGSTFSDSEWANTSSGRFESYVLDVVRDVDHRFSTLARRQARVIAGFSAGAYGAMDIALHHLTVFGNVQSWSGYFTQTRSGVFAQASSRRLGYDSPLDFALHLGRRLAADPLRIYMFVGRDDSSSRQQPVMVRALRADGASVQARVYPGGHDWSVWYPRLNSMLDLASRQAVMPLPRAHPGLPLLRAARAPAVFSAPAAHRGRRHSELLLLGTLVLALISAALINLGFVLQHRAQERAPRLLGAFRDRVWLLGQGIGWAGFSGQIVAVAVAPLTLVQAFSAGSLALSVPLAARAFGQRVSRTQLAAIGIIALCLISLPLGFSGGHGRLHAGLLIASAMVALLGAAALAPALGPAARALAAGTLYGAGDAAIKADALGLRFHGAGLLSGWTLLAGLCTLGGFLCFQAALRESDAVRPLSLMNALTAITAVLLGVLAFGEPLGTGSAASAAHALAIVLVLACVPSLAGAQQRFLGPAAARAPSPALSHVAWRSPTLPPSRGARTALIGLAASAALVLGVLAGTGLLYGLRGAGLTGPGLPVPDALPLLQLAGFDAQPLLGLLAAWLAAGVLVGALVPAGSRRRFVYLGLVAVLLLLVLSDASYALARNLPFDHVLLDRAPGLGPWLEGLTLAGGAALARPIGRRCLDLVPAAPRRLRAGHRVLAPIAAGGLGVALLLALALPDDHARAHVRHHHVRHHHRAPARAKTTVRSSSKRALVSRFAASPAPGRLYDVHFYSAALRREADYLVYLPAEYSPAHRLPVLYLLHGMPGRPLAFTVNAGIEVKLEQLIHSRRAAPMILVFPDGRIRGNTQSDSEWANTRAGHFESYVVDVVHDVDRRFATLPERTERAIGGLSAGAYGAANIGLHQLGLFGLIQVWSGYFSQTPSGVFDHASPAQLGYNSPIDYVRGLRAALARYPLHAFLYVGRADGDRRQTPPMTAALIAEGAEAAYAFYPGGHNWGLWTPHVDQMLILASRAFAAQAVEPPLPISRP